MSYLWQAATGQRLPLQTSGYRPGDRYASGFSDIDVVSAAPAHRFGARFRKSSRASDARVASSAGVSLGAQISYRKAAALLRMFLQPMGGTTHTTTRSRVNAVGERIDENRFRGKLPKNRKPDKSADQMIIGTDGARQRSASDGPS